MTASLLAVAAAGAAATVVLYGWILVVMLGTYADAAIDTWTSASDLLFAVLPWLVLTAALSFLAWLFAIIRRIHRLGRGGGLVSPSAGVYLALMLVPYGVMKELRKAVVPDDRSLGGHLLGAWWAAWLGTVALCAFWARFADGDLPMPDDPRVLAILGVACGLACTAMFGLTAWNVRVISAGAASAPTPD